MPYKSRPRTDSRRKLRGTHFADEVDEDDFDSADEDDLEEEAFDREDEENVVVIEPQNVTR